MIYLWYEHVDSLRILVAAAIFSIQHTVAACICCTNFWVVKHFLPEAPHFIHGALHSKWTYVQDAKHLKILTDIMEDTNAPLSLKVAVCTILRAAAQAEAVSMSALTQVPGNSLCCVS